MIILPETQIYNDGNKRTAVIFANHFLISRGKCSYESNIIKELNNSVHLSDALAIGINVFEFPLISRNLYDEVQKMPASISL